MHYSKEISMLTVDQAINKRRSVRNFKREPVSEEMILQMLESARLAPSGSNSQPWRFIVVTDQEEKTRLRQASQSQATIEDAGVIFVTCADLSVYSKQSFLQRRQEAITAGILPASSLSDPEFLQRLDTMSTGAQTENIIRATANTYIAAEHIVLTATSLGLGSCWIGAFDHEAVKTFYNLPDYMQVAVLIAVGHATTIPPVRPHLPLKDILLRPYPHKK
jgi:nitroreductase